MKLVCTIFVVSITFWSIVQSDEGLNEDVVDSNDISSKELATESQENNASIDNTMKGLVTTTTNTNQSDQSSEQQKNTSSSQSNTYPTKVECHPKPEDEQILQVKIVNSSELRELLDSKKDATSNSKDKDSPTKDTNSTKICSIVLFYYPWCTFSSKAAPHFNALGRLYPHINVMAIDAYANNDLNMRFGLVGVPSILLFQNSKLVAKFNDSTPTIEGLVSFLHRLTGLNPKSASLEITDIDMAGPVPTTPESRPDYVLILSWIFVLCCFVHFLIRSSWFKRMTETIRNNWREAEQTASGPREPHEHQD